MYESIIIINNSYIIVNNNIAKWRLSALDIHELPLMAANTEMRLVPRLTNTGNPAMSPHAEGKKGRRVHVTLYIYVTGPNYF